MKFWILGIFFQGIDNKFSGKSYIQTEHNGKYILLIPRQGSSFSPPRTAMYFKREYHVLCCCICMMIN